MHLTAGWDQGLEQAGTLRASKEGVKPQSSGAD